MIDNFLIKLTVDPMAWESLLVTFVTICMLVFISSINHAERFDGVVVGVCPTAITWFLFGEWSQRVNLPFENAHALFLALVSILLYGGLRRRKHRTWQLLGKLSGLLLGGVVAWFAVTAAYAGDFSPIEVVWILALPIMYTLLSSVKWLFLGRWCATVESAYPHRLLLRIGFSRHATVRTLVVSSLLLGGVGMLARQHAIQDGWLAAGFLLMLLTYVLFASHAAHQLADLKPSDVAESNKVSSAAVHPQEQLLILEPGRADKNYWMDLWRYRELFLILAWRDIAVRYKQTIIGVAWAIVRPFLTMVVFTVIFGRVAKLPSGGNTPYALMVFAAMLPWFLFSTSLTEASNSLIGNANLISKVYFPRLIVPAATVVTAFIDFLISFVILLGLMVYYQFAPSWNFLLLPVFILLALMASLGPGLWITALNVKYRDFRYIIPFIVQFGLYVSPVGFSSNVIPERWRLLYSLNPMVGVIDGFRWCILGVNDSPINWSSFLLSLTIVAFFLWLGVSQFRKMEKTFADLI